MRLVPETTRERTFIAVYLAVVAATIAFVVSTHVVFEGDGTANLSGVWLFVVTLPWSMALTSMNQPGRQFPFVVVALGLLGSAGLNAVLLGRAGDAVHRRRRGRESPRR